MGDPIEAPTLIFWSMRPTKPGTTGLLRVPTDNPRHVRTTNLQHNHKGGSVLVGIWLLKDRALAYTPSITD